MTIEEIRKEIVGLLKTLAELDESLIHSETPLIGPEAAISSHLLVELMLALEDYTEDTFGLEFGWTCEVAMSRSRSVFRTVGTLADYLHSLVKDRA